MRVVYQLKDSLMKRNTSSAEMFGDVKVCLTQKDDGLSPGMVLNRLRSALRDYGPGDYILWAGGDWSIVLAAGIVLRELNVKSIDLLVWKRLADETAAYVPIRIVI